MKFDFIAKHCRQYSVTLMCKVLGVSRSGYYAYRNRRPSRRETANTKLLVEIQEIHYAKRQVYGSPRIHAELVNRGVACSKNRVARLMRKAEIRAKTKRKFKVTTDSGHNLPIKENLLQRDFKAERPNKVWVADITYIHTDEGWLYMAAVLDLYSRRVVGWHMAPHMRTELVEKALEMAVKQRRPGPNLIHHSDRGSQYASNDYQRFLNKHGMLCSMSRKGDCWDNAPMESFFKTLKTELVAWESYRTRKQAKRSISEYILGFYNSDRLHSTLGYTSPNEFEQPQRAQACVA